MVNPLRFSLAALVGVILLCSVYFAALRYSSILSADLALTLSVGLLAAGLLWALVGKGPDRWFWIGFQLGGWGYLLLAFSTWSQAQLGERLLTTHLAAVVHERMPLANPRDVMVEWHGHWYAAEVLRRSGGQHFIHYTGYGANWDEWVGPSRIRGQLGPFLHICHALFTLLFALVGGTVAACLAPAERSRGWFWIVWGTGIVAVLGTSAWAMMYDSELAASAALSLLLLVLLLAAVAACAGPSSQRAFALGFAILGCGYFFLHYAPGVENSVGPKLLSTRLLQWVYEWQHPAQVTSTNAGWAISGTTAYPPTGFTGFYPTNTAYVNSQQTNSWMVAGHSLLAILVSLAGGFAALWMSRRAANRQADASATRE